jgi:hypothetical protein
VKKRTNKWRRELLRQIERGHLDPYRHFNGKQAFKALIDAMAIAHPAVIMPKEKSLPALIHANPRADFLRRLAAANN